MKLLLHFAEPLGIVWLLLTAFLALRLWQRQYRGILLPGAAWIVFTAFTCTPLASLWLASLEARFPPVESGDVPACDAIVCLGGGAAPSPAEPSGVHLKSAGDRLTAALVMVRMQKKRPLVLGGGGYKVHGRWTSEADTLAERLRPMMDEPHEIISLGMCADTHDEAVRTAELARVRGWHHIALVTSAYHMPRAAATFEKQGLQVTPVPCNYVTSRFRGGDLEWLHAPGYGGLEKFSLWLHEILGSFYYHWKGWT